MNGEIANTSNSSIVGPMIGGALAAPVKNFPSLFAPGTIWERFPYLLPNLFSAICVMVGVIIGLLFLEETHAEKKYRRDPGIELGKSLISCLPGFGSQPAKDAEEQPLLAEREETLPRYLTNGGSTSPSPTSNASLQEPMDLEEGGGAQPAKADAKSTGKIFTKPVVTIIGSYGILAL